MFNQSSYFFGSQLIVILEPRGYHPSSQRFDTDTVY